MHIGPAHDWPFSCASPCLGWGIVTNALSHSSGQKAPDHLADATDNKRGSLLLFTPDHARGSSAWQVASLGGIIGLAAHGRGWMTRFMGEEAGVDSLCRHSAVCAVLLEHFLQNQEC
jgi:hypothetical protein